VANTQIRLHPNGPWCRPDFQRRETGCGKPITGPYASRDWELDLELCKDGCFSQHERDTGELVMALAGIEEEHPEQYHAVDEDPTDRIAIPPKWYGPERRKP
jgi:hypothetical protein